MAASTRDDPGAYVVSFSGNGTLHGVIKLGRFSPYQLVVFPSGRFLVSGTQGPQHTVPITAIFESSGKQLKTIYEPEDEEFRKKAAGHDSDYFSVELNYDNRAVWEGDAALGSDGNAYLLRAVSPALIYVISPEGEVLRKLHVESPEFGLRPRSLKAAPGRLAIAFTQEHWTMGFTRVVDLRGNVIATYSADDKTIYPGLPGCYTPPTFRYVFAEDGNGKVSLQEAKPE